MFCFWIFQCERDCSQRKNEKNIFFFSHGKCKVNAVKTLVLVFQSAKSMQTERVAEGIESCLINSVPQFSISLVRLLIIIKNLSQPCFALFKLKIIIIKKKHFQGLKDHSGSPKTSYEPVCVPHTEIIPPMSGHTEY